MLFNKTGQGGFVKMIVLIVIGLIVLGYFGYNIADIVKNPTVDSNLNWVWGLVKTVWNNYLKVPIVWVWDNIVIGLGWHSIERLKDYFDSTNANTKDAKEVVLNLFFIS